MISILKRTREEVSPATDPITYTNWSDWGTTTDIPPYTNTALVEYKTGTTYRDETLSVFRDLMTSSIGENTPYALTLAYLQTELDDSNLTPKEKATLKAQVMSNITSSITNNAMQLSPTIANKELRIDSELAMLLNQKDVSEATKGHKILQSEQQLENTKQSALFMKEKITQLVKAAKDNNRIQAGNNFGEYLGQKQISDTTVTEDEIALLLTMIKDLYNNAETSVI